MSDLQRNAVKSGIFLIIAAGVSLLTFLDQPEFFIPLILIIAFIFLIAGAQAMESWRQRRKEGGKATTAQRRRAAEPKKSSGTRKGASVVVPAGQEAGGSQAGFYGLVPRSMLPGAGDKPTKRPRR